MKGRRGFGWRRPFSDSQSDPLLGPGQTGKITKKTSIYFLKILKEMDHISDGVSIKLAN